MSPLLHYIRHGEYSVVGTKKRIAFHADCEIVV